MMTDEAYIAAYQKLSSQYHNNQSSMETTWLPFRS